MIPPSKIEAFIASLTVTQGRFAGERFILLPWQRKFIHGVFGPGVKTAALSVPRGAGKTTLIAAVASAIVVSPRTPRASEITLVAGIEKQSMILFIYYWEPPWLGCKSSSPGFM